MSQAPTFGKRGIAKPATIPARRSNAFSMVSIGVVASVVAIGWFVMRMPKPLLEPEIAGVASIGQMWVTADRAERRTCSSSFCGVAGRYLFREAANVLEISGNWARVTKYYDASCKDGLSQYIKDGNTSCSAANGIVDGQFAEWVNTSVLSPIRPADPAAAATGIAKLVGGSTDFRIYEAAFVQAATTLMASGTCTKHDFEEMGGFMKASNQKYPGPIYFTYCGGMTAANRLYLNASTGAIFK